MRAYRAQRVIKVVRVNTRRMEQRRAHWAERLGTRATADELARVEHAHFAELYDCFHRRRGFVAHGTKPRRHITLFGPILDVHIFDIGATGYQRVELGFWTVDDPAPEHVVALLDWLMSSRWQRFSEWNCYVPDA